jgi:hypothetical protein
VRPSPGIPCALSSRGRSTRQSSDAKAPRGCDHAARESDAARSADRTVIHRTGKAWFPWCCQTGLNCRPLPYQGSALPLSYGSIQHGERIGPMATTQRGGSCHKVLAHASARGRCGDERNPQIGQSRAKAVIIRSDGAVSGIHRAGRGRFLPIPAGDGPRARIYLGFLTMRHPAATPSGVVERQWDWVEATWPQMRALGDRKDRQLQMIDIIVAQRR